MDKNRKIVQQIQTGISARGEVGILKVQRLIG